MKEKVFCPLQDEDEVIIHAYLSGLSKEESLRVGGFNEAAVDALKVSYFRAPAIKKRIEELKTAPEYVQVEVDVLRKIKLGIREDDFTPPGLTKEYVQKRLRDIIEKCNQTKKIKYKDGTDAPGRFNPEGAVAALKLACELQGHFDKQEDDVKIPEFEIILSEKKA